MMEMTAPSTMEQAMASAEMTRVSPSPSKRKRMFVQVSKAAMSLISGLLSGRCLATAARCGGGATHTSDSAAIRGVRGAHGAAVGPRRRVDAVKLGVREIATSVGHGGTKVLVPSTMVVTPAAMAWAAACPVMSWVPGVTSTASAAKFLGGIAGGHVAVGAHAMLKIYGTSREREADGEIQHGGGHVGRPVVARVPGRRSSRST